MEDCRNRRPSKNAIHDACFDVAHIGEIAMSDDAIQLRKTVGNMHGGTATSAQVVPVHETFESKTPIIAEQRPKR
jgi:hypothetical protein